jgi:hypothetical protein
MREFSFSTFCLQGCEMDSRLCENDSALKAFPSEGPRDHGLRNFKKLGLLLWAQPVQMIRVTISTRTIKRYLALPDFCWYNTCMRKPGRPKPKHPLDEYIELRVSKAEKRAFRDAAERSGLALSSWMRERLRRVAIRELENADLPVAFLK